MYSGTFDEYSYMQYMSICKASRLFLQFVTRQFEFADVNKSSE